MSRPKGIPKTGGRKKGGLNQSTKLFRDALASNGIDLATEISRLVQVAPAERQLDTLIQLLPYVYPKLKTIEENINIDLPRNRIESMSEEEISRELKSFYLQEAARCEDPEVAAAYKKIGAAPSDNSR